MFKYANLNPCRVDCIVYETVKGSSNHSTKVKYAEYFANGTQCRVREVCVNYIENPINLHDMSNFYINLVLIVLLIDDIDLSWSKM